MIGQKKKIFRLPSSFPGRLSDTSRPPLEGRNPKTRTPAGRCASAGAAIAAMAGYPSVQMPAG
jgi:hypothetical protein